jgi:hypothetical protein
LAVNGYINVIDGAAGDMIFAALTITSSGIPVKGLEVTLNGTALSERKRTYNYQGAASGMDIAAGSGINIEIASRPSLTPPVHGRTVLATVAGTVAGVIRFSIPPVAPPPHSLTGDKITFAWKYQGTIAAPIDVLLYDKNSGALVYENRGYMGSDIALDSSLIAMRKPYLLELLKNMDMLRPAGAAVTPHSEVALRYLADLNIPPRLL